MTREELKSLVDKELGSTKLTGLTERTINEELDDMLDEFGEDAEKNSELVTRIANRLKRMDGNFHAQAADVKKQWEEDWKKKHPESQNATGPHKDDNPDDPYGVKALKAELEEMKNERKKERTERNRKEVLGSVRSGLKDKFDKAGMKLNGFFEKTALARLEIPEENADIASLVDQAEKLYNADMKEANVELGKPHAGTGGGDHKGPSDDDDQWDDVRQLCGVETDKK